MTTYVSLYERRVKIVSDTLREHSELPEKVAAELAVHVLDVLDHIPEKMR
ncbi:DUF6307 family protein [Labedaea rhizosphaerae]|uniref:Uncharacterized protein n=1 Tax=Labedaea rhizosphaerae TaxID=598644 RepID=A0A4R6SK22_LABRH|nr:DUF6307 family protein [Labedaea rhizosphaerae]TDQ04448.1 hypothetical protein EV186_101400 [Labedaea rhizosphaerae]